MIIVRVELHSAISGKVTEIARAHIVNDGTGNHTLGNYDVLTLWGRDKETLDKGRWQEKGKVGAYPRERLHVWNLVARALEAMGYG